VHLSAKGRQPGAPCKTNNTTGTNTNTPTRAPIQPPLNRQLRHQQRPEGLASLKHKATASEKEQRAECWSPPKPNIVHEIGTPPSHAQLLYPQQEGSGKPPDNAIPQIVENHKGPRGVAGGGRQPIKTTPKTNFFKRRFPPKTPKEGGGEKAN